MGFEADRIIEEGLLGELDADIRREQMNKDNSEVMIPKADVLRIIDEYSSTNLAKKHFVNPANYDDMVQEIESLG